MPAPSVGPVDTAVLVFAGGSLSAAFAEILSTEIDLLSEDDLAQLTSLAELKTAGILTEAEFAVEKARILG